MPIDPPVRQAHATPALLVAALAAAGMLAAILPGGRWNDALALVASAAALFAAHERRDRDMIVAAGLAAGLAPAGLLLAPLWLGLAIRRRGVWRHLPIAALAGAAACVLLPWPTPIAALPNLAALAMAVPKMLALTVALGAGIAAWVAARASVLMPAALFAEARLSAVLLTILLPLPIGAVGFALILVALPLPSPRPQRAANDNWPLQRRAGLAA